MTEKRYFEKLVELSEVSPNNVLLESLRRGYSAVNVVYLQAAFEQLAKKPSVVLEDNELYAETDLHLSADNEVLRDLDEQRRGLYRDLFETRKRFFDYPFSDAYNESRAEVSRDVQLIQKRIAALKQKIRNYVETGQLDTEEDNDPSVSKVFIVPTDAYERMKKLNSLTSSLSRKEREIRELAGREGVNLDKNVLKTKEKARDTLRINLKLLKSAIEADQQKIL